jgi:hypothetical protein
VWAVATRAATSAATGAMLAWSVDVPSIVDADVGHESEHSFIHVQQLRHA